MQNLSVTMTNGGSSSESDNTSSQPLQGSAAPFVFADAATSGGSTPVDRDTAWHENKAAFEHHTVAIMVVQDRIVTRCNKTLGELYGRQPDDIVGAPADLFFRLADDPACDPHHALDVLSVHGSSVRKAYVQRDDGTVICVNASAHAFETGGIAPRTIWFLEHISDGVLADIAWRRNQKNEERILKKARELQASNLKLREKLSVLAQAEQRMWHVAHHDPLTGLANRALLVDRLAHALTVARRGKNGVAIMFIDLDRFKNINDTFGHDVGDKFLCAIASRLNQAVRKSDLVARFGGDEFVILMEQVAHPNDVHGVAQKILDVLRMPVRVASHDLHPTASIGIRHCPDREYEYDSDKLLCHADRAMYRAKKHGGNAFVVFDAALEKTAQPVPPSVCGSVA